MVIEFYKFNKHFLSIEHFNNETITIRQDMLNTLTYKITLWGNCSKTNVQRGFRLQKETL